MPKCSISVLKLKHAWQLVLIQIINGRLLAGNKSFSHNRTIHE